MCSSLSSQKNLNYSLINSNGTFASRIGKKHVIGDFRNSMDRCRGGKNQLLNAHQAAIKHCIKRYCLLKHFI